VKGRRAKSEPHSHPACQVCRPQKVTKTHSCWVEIGIRLERLRHLTPDSLFTHVYALTCITPGCLGTIQYGMEMQSAVVGAAP
jgi:hypothetical protein